VLAHSSYDRERRSRTPRPLTEAVSHDLGREGCPDREADVSDQPGSSPEPRVAFAAQLRDLRAQCGKPTQQELADAMHCGRTMVSEMLTGRCQGSVGTARRRFPTWKQAWALVTACAGSDSKELEERWRARWLGRPAESWMLCDTAKQLPD